MINTRSTSTATSRRLRTQDDTLDFGLGGRTEFFVGQRLVEGEGGKGMRGEEGGGGVLQLLHCVAGTGRKRKEDVNKRLASSG